MSIALSPQRLREARDARNISRQAAAVAVDRSVSTLQSWEKGLNEPGASDVARLATLYGVPLASLFVHEGNGTTPDAVCAVSDDKNTPAPAASSGQRSAAGAR